MLCLKIIIVGDTSKFEQRVLGVGKSCLLLQFTDSRFKESHDATIGIGFGQKEITHENQQINLHIWDTAGQESFRSLTRSFYRGAVGGILVFDVTNRYSFDSLVKWYEKIKGYACDDIELIIVGNKNDLSDQYHISFDKDVKFHNQKVKDLPLNMILNISKHQLKLVYKLVTYLKDQLKKY